MPDGNTIGSFIQSLTPANTFVYTAEIRAGDRIRGGARIRDQSRSDRGGIVLDDRNRNPNTSRS